MACAPPKTCRHQKSFLILQPTTQIPREWIGFFLFKKNVLVGHPNTYIESESESGKGEVLEG